MNAMDTMDGSETPPRRLEISITQLLAGSAAAVCGAWLASKIGVAGTVIGAGLVSALVTVLSAVYAQGARRAREQLLLRRELVRTRGQLPATYAADSPATADAEATADEAVTSTHPLFLPPFDLEDAGGYRWGRIALAALAVFLVGMAAVTTVELVVGHSFACTAAGIGCQGSTTLPIPGRTHASTEPTPPTPSTRPSSLPSSAAPSGSTSPTPSSSGSVSTTPSPSATPSGTATGSGSPSPSVSPSGSQTPAG